MLFLHGGYTPLVAEGSRAQHVIAYARRHGGRTIIAIGGRLFAGMGIAQSALPCGELAWGDTRVAVPFLREGAQLTEVLGGHRVALEGGALMIARAWADLPGAVLVGEGQDA